MDAMVGELTLQLAQVPQRRVVKELVHELDAVNAEILAADLRQVGVLPAVVAEEAEVE
jgi:hypothetical protein